MLKFEARVASTALTLAFIWLPFWPAGPIAGNRKTLALDNRTAYHGQFDFLRLEPGFEPPSSWLIGSCCGSSTSESK
jgi:hypothetical protein